VTCTASDKAGNAATSTAPYTVAYAQKLLYNTTAAIKSGTTLAVTLQLQDAVAVNVSSANIAVTAVDVVNSGGAVVQAVNAPFSFAKGQYTYKLDTAGLAPGTYSLRFTAGSDSTTHLAPFVIK